MAEWLNTAFYAFDAGIFRAVSSISNNFLTAFFSVITLLGEKGLGPLILGAVFLLFNKTRRAGLTILFAVGVGALFTNLLIKNLVARPRPYVENQEFRLMWEAVGANLESEFSFPSGHTTALTAGGLALFLTCNKKWSFVGLIVAVLVGFSRIYLVVHYPTDVLAGFIVGSLGAVIAYFIVKGIYALIAKKDNRFTRFTLNADFRNLFKK